MDGQEDNPPTGEPTQPAEPQPSTAEYAKYQPPQKPRRNFRKPIVVLLAAFLVLVTGGAIYALVLSKKPSTKPTQQTQNQTSQHPTRQINAETAHYASQNFKLEFDYPADWKSPQDNNEQLSFISPTIELKDANATDVNGQIVMIIQAKTMKLENLDRGNASAVIDSKKVAYTKPGPNQRGETYITYVRYSGLTDGFSGIYITGNSGYTKDQAVPKIDIEKVDPIIYIEFEKCPEQGCTQRHGSFSLNSSLLNDKNFIDPLESMLKSLTIN